MRTCRRFAERMLFVQGTRDPFGTRGRDRGATALPPDTLSCTKSTDGDHSFKVPARKGDVLEGIMDTVAAWILAGRERSARQRLVLHADEVGARHEIEAPPSRRIHDE